ncbi:hypothetical protein, partial [Campylobacter lari]|uniref:hypothetical protein n=1 Tax=Campylobacter lari TaxID=201 RepID=UPI0021C045F4
INNKNTITGNISLNNNSYISNIRNSGVVKGGVNLDNNSLVNTIINTGIIGNEATTLNTQDITYGINNSGTIEKLINSSGGLSVSNADKDIHIYGGINNSGYIDIFNTGNIHGGITNNGTLIINNSHIYFEKNTGKAYWHSGFIGKNNNGYHLENNNGGK